MKTYELTRVMRTYDLKLFKNKFYETKFSAHLEAYKKKMMSGIFWFLCCICEWNESDHIFLSSSSADDD